MVSRGLYKGAAACAIGYAIVSLASYTAWISANGFLAASATPPTADQIIKMAQAGGNRISVQLDLLSYFLLIPALVGLFAFLRERTPGRAMLGGAFAVFGFLGLFPSTILNSVSLTLAQSPVTDALKDRLSGLSMISAASFLPGLWAIAISNLLWAMAFRTETGLARTVGNLLVAQVAGFAVATAGFLIGNDTIGNTGILIQVLGSVATFASAAILLQRSSQQETEIRPEAQRPRAAAASSGH